MIISIGWYIYHYRNLASSNLSREISIYSLTILWKIPDSRSRAKMTSRKWQKVKSYLNGTYNHSQHVLTQLQDKKIYLQIINKSLNQQIYYYCTLSWKGVSYMIIHLHSTYFYVSYVSNYAIILIISFLALCYLLYDFLTSLGHPYQRGKEHWTLAYGPHGKKCKLTGHNQKAKHCWIDYERYDN